MNQHDHSHHSELGAAFLTDHRVLTRGIDAIHHAVVAKDLPKAQKLAEQLDQEVGPHIEFEERYLYPFLERSLGPDRVRDLCSEHRAGRAALRTLLESAGAAESDLSQVEAQLKIMSDHALACGTLASHVEALDEEQRRELLAHLLELRSTPRRWTDLEISG